MDEMEILELINGCETMRPIDEYPGCGQTDKDGNLITCESCDYCYDCPATIDFRPIDFDEELRIAGENYEAD